MSGYEKSGPSKLGGGVPGGRPSAGFANTNTSSEMALKRKILRKAFKTNKVNKTNVRATCGPFRAANNLGDVLNRRNKSCGGCNQVNDTTSNVLNSKKADGVSNADCGTTTVNGITFSTTEVPLASGNSKYVSNSSEFTKFKELEAINLNYNDSSFGGDQHNASYTFINNLRG